MAVRAARTRDFARLKLRLLGNGLRGSAARTALFILAGLFGASLAIGGFIGLLFGTIVRPDIAFAVAVFAGSALVLAWALLPVLFFGVDETLDPARFALLPVPRRTLLRGMFVAALLGIPAVATLIASLALPIARAVEDGPVVALVSLFGALSGLVLGVVASRAITGAFAAMLRSRRVRDLAAVLIAVVAASIGPLQWLILSATENSNLSQATSVARVLGWTPLGAGYAMPFDAAQGRWWAVAVKAVIVLASIAVFAWWWESSVESAMLGSIADGRAGPAGPVTGGAVRSLVPRFLRPNAFGAIVGRELRSWWRDGRRRASLISIMMAGVVVPVALRITSGAAQASGRASPLLTGFAVTMSGAMAGLLLANQFAFDGSAYATHLMTRVSGRTELRARATALGLILLPILAVVVGVVTAAIGEADQIPHSIGLMAAAFGCSVASASTLSVLAAFPMPESTNPFAMNSGGGSAKGLLSFVAIIVTFALCAPLLLAGAYLTDGWSAWLILPIGLAYGLGIAMLGTVLAGNLLQRRGPEVLIAITPKR